MPLTKSTPSPPQSGLRHRQKCWNCGAEAPFFLIHPASQNPICQDCALSEGREIPVSLSDDEVGTIEVGKRSRPGG